MFGILHGLENQREALARVCRSEYPKLEAELWALETKENRGVLALLLDTLVDLELIKEQATRPQSSVPSSDKAGGMDGDHGREQDALMNAAVASGVLSMTEKDSEKET